MQEVAAKNPLIRLYYSQRLFMGFCCVSCEVLYLACFSTCHPSAALMAAAAPDALQPFVASAAGCSAAGVDVATAALLLVSLPGFAVKQVVNVYQLWESMVKLALLEKKVH